MRPTTLLCLVVLLLVSSLGAHAEGVREERPNLVFGEIGGKAILFSAGYEHYFNNRFGLGAGAVGWGAEGGGIGLFPIYATLTPVGDIHSLYLSGGITYFAGSANWEDGWAAWLWTASVGYQYQSETGFFVRPTMNMLHKDEGFVVIPGIAFGGSF